MILKERYQNPSSSRDESPRNAEAIFGEVEGQIARQISDFKWFNRASQSTSINLKFDVFKDCPFKATPPHM